MMLSTTTDNGETTYGIRLHRAIRVSVLNISLEVRSESSCGSIRLYGQYAEGKSIKYVMRRKVILMYHVFYMMPIIAL